MTKKQRLFLAANFSAPARAHLLDLASLIKAENGQGRFCQPEQLHLTLVFLGDCGPAQLLLAKRAMDETEFLPFNLVINSLGRFQRRGGDLWWAGLAENKQLTKLQNELAGNLARAGFQLDSRPYRPHITLARNVKSALLPRQLEPFTEQVSQVDLMESTRISSKMVYTCIHQRAARLDPTSGS
jgi:2'-5' RNA ligase